MCIIDAVCLFVYLFVCLLLFYYIMQDRHRESPTGRQRLEKDPEEDSKKMAS